MLRKDHILIAWENSTHKQNHNTLLCKFGEQIREAVIFLIGYKGILNPKEPNIKLIYPLNSTDSEQLQLPIRAHEVAALIENLEER